MNDTLTDKLIRKKNGRYLLHLFNIYLLLSHHDEWKGKFVLHLGMVLYKTRPPYERKGNRYLRDADYLRIKLFISSELGGTPDSTIVREAVRLVAEDS